MLNALPNDQLFLDNLWDHIISILPFYGVALSATELLSGDFLDRLNRLSTYLVVSLYRFS